MEEIIWDGGVVGDGLPICDVDIAYNRIFDKFEVVAFDKEGQMMIQKNGHWMPGVKNHYLFPTINNEQTGKAYASNLGAAFVEASYEFGIRIERDYNKPEFCFSKNTEKTLKKLDIKLDLQELINFGAGVVKQYAKDVVMKDIKNGEIKEDEIEKYLEQKEYVKKIKRELKNEYSTPFTLNDLNEQKETLEELKKEFDNLCELKAGHLIQRFTNQDKNLEVDEELELNPILFAKSIHNYESNLTNTNQQQKNDNIKYVMNIKTQTGENKRILVEEKEL